MKKISNRTYEDIRQEIRNKNKATLDTKENELYTKIVNKNTVHFNEYAKLIYFLNY